MSGKRKRADDQKIDEKTLQNNGLQRKQEKAQPNLNYQIHERKIYKIVKTNEKLADKGETKTKQKEEKTIFPSQKEKQEEKIKKEQKVLDQQQDDKSSIFGCFKSENGFGIFTTGNLFDLSKTIFPQNSLFNFPVSNEKEILWGKEKGMGEIFSANVVDDGSGNSSELEKEQENKIDPLKSVGNYQYKDECEILFHEKALKYKKDDGELVQNVDVVVRKDKQTRISTITVRLMATKNNIFTGFLIKGKSQIKYFSKKQENICLTSADGKKFQKHTLRFQFQKPIYGRNLLNVVEKLE